MPQNDPPPDSLSQSPDMAPIVWLLIDDRPGHRTQVVGLARSLGGSALGGSALGESALGESAMEKRLVFNRLNRLPNPLLGAGLLSLDLVKSDPLTAPYPDLVIGMGRRVVPIARWIKRENSGRSRVVLLGRKAVNDPRAVDLSIACAHFQPLAHDRMVELVVPPTQVDGQALAAARATHGDPVADLARPRVLLLTGGPTVHHRFDAPFAGRMAAEVATATNAQGGSLAIVTSRRTPQASVAAMRLAAPQAHVHEWRADQPSNPYLAYLAAADLIVVTGESESMLAEATATTRPLTIYPLPPKPESARQKLARLVRRGAGGGGPWGALCRAALEGGWITPPRDLDLMHALIVARGQAGLFASGGLNTSAPRASLEGRKLAERIIALLDSAP
jgi:mitochondrial fission protein ELM1